MTRGLLLLVLPLLLATGVLAAPGDWHARQEARSTEVGFPRYVLTREIRAGLDRPLPGKSPWRTLLAGTRLELLAAPPILEGKPWGLLGDGKVVWVPRDALRADPSTLDLSRDELIHLPGALITSPPYCQIPGVFHSTITWRSSRMTLIEVDLDVNNHLEFYPVVTDFFLQGRERGRRVALVKTMVEEEGGVLGVNGTYFSTGSRNWGTPLGPLVAGGKILSDDENPSAMLYKRSYLAWTSHGRFVTGELDGGVRPLLGTHQGEGPGKDVLVPGEKVVHLIGGLGRLARGGNPEAWREVFRGQFDASFYSRKTRRAQILFGVGERGRCLYLLAQEGYPHSERRNTLPELGWILVGLGAREVLFGDGGGSTDLVYQGEELVRTENFKPRRKVSSAMILRSK